MSSILKTNINDCPLSSECDFKKSINDVEYDCLILDFWFRIDSLSINAEKF